jgi:hypothetical protein
MGYVAASSPRELRAILGVPGAAVFSDPLLLPEDVTRVRVAPGQSYALIERNNQETAVLPLSGGLAGAAVAIGGALQAADFVSFSPSGRSAILISATAGRLQAITGLPELPQVVEDLDVSALPETPCAAAISDDAGSVLLSSSRTVYLLSPDGSTRFVGAVADGASLAFLPSSGKAAIADRAVGSVYLFQPQTGGSLVSLVATGLNTTGEITASADGELLYVTDPGGQHIQSVKVLSGEVRSFDLPVPPLKMDRLKSTDTFLISTEVGRPGWILFRDGNNLSTAFIPAISSIFTESSSSRNHLPDMRDR